LPNSHLTDEGYEIQADVDNQEAAILAVAASNMNRQDFLEWLQGHVVPR